MRSVRGVTRTRTRYDEHGGICWWSGCLFILLRPRHVIRYWGAVWRAPVVVLTCSSPGMFDYHGLLDICLRLLGSRLRTGCRVSDVSCFGPLCILVVAFTITSQNMALLLCCCIAIKQDMLSGRIIVHKQVDTMSTVL